MADGKQVPLSIILRTVDKATAGINAVNKRLDAITKPTRDLGKALSDLSEKSGLNAVGDAFGRVGGAVSDLLGKVAVVGGAIAAAAVGVLSLVDHFDRLGDTAERLGTTADFLAAFRYAAERAGAPLEGVDEALQTLVTNMGQAKAGTGKMLKFLQQISPVLAKQVTAANSLEEALGLLADAEAKIPDAARRAALAQKTLGDKALAPLLARGSKGVQELLTEFYGLAGGLGDATEAAGKTDDSIKKLHASAEGAKAALVTGLAPALTIVVDKLTKWFVDHRADIAKWGDEIGKKLPGAIEDAVKWIDTALDRTTKFVEQIGGLKTVAIAAAAVIAGPLLASIISLSAAVLATPAGLALAGLGALALGILEVSNRDDKGLGVTKFDTVTAQNPEIGFAEALQKDEEDDKRKAARQKVDDLVKRLNAQREVDAATALQPAVNAAAVPQQSKLLVEFANAPKGLRVTQDPRNPATIDTTVGYQMMGYGT